MNKPSFHCFLSATVSGIIMINLLALLPLIKHLRSYQEMENSRVSVKFMK